MDKEEAQRILFDELKALRVKSHAKLSGLIGSPAIFERQGSSGAVYQLEIQACWDDPGKPAGNLRVIASIDDGRFPSVFVPVSADFIMSPDGNFVDE